MHTENPKQYLLKRKRFSIGLIATLRYNSNALRSFGRFAGNAYLCIRKSEERSWFNYSPIKSIPQ